MTYYIATVWYWGSPNPYFFNIVTKIHPLQWLEKRIEKDNESPDRIVLTFFKEIPESIYNELIKNPKFKDFVFLGEKI